MSLGRLNFDDISEADLTALINAGIPEGILIDYKRETYGNSDHDVKEFLKDVSSFANTAGGHLVIGMDETGGVASAITPITGLDADQESLRLENLTRDGIEPRIHGVRMRAIPIAVGGFVIVVRVPRSWNPPHRTIARKSNRFYVRNSAGTHEASVEELRVLFNVSATVNERIRAFRQERLAKITAGEGPVRLSQDRGRILLHMVPFSAFSALSQIDLAQTTQLQGSLRPMGSVGFTPRFNFDGFINIAGGNPCHGYTQLFRNGIIEAVLAGMVVDRDGRAIIPSLSLEQYILDAIPFYLTALRSLEISTPVAVMVTIEGVHGAFLGVSNHQFYFDQPAPISQSVLELPEVVIDDYGTPDDYQRTLRPAFDALWNAGGFPASRHFNADGVWIGSQAH
jgi:hypothetical protein